MKEVPATDLLARLYEPRHEDVHFLRSVNFTFSELPERFSHGGWNLVGERPADNPNGKGRIELWVSCVPARFWKARITPTDKDSKVVTLCTGSGDVASFWGIFELFGASMVGVETTPTNPEVQASWVDPQGLDAETLVEITTLFDRSLWQKLIQVHDLSCTQLHEFLYSACHAFQQIHAGTDWNEHGDYWGAVEAYVEKINTKAAEDPNWIDWDIKAFKQIHNAAKCNSCGDTGIRPDSTTHAGPLPEGFVAVERCDSCDRYADDLEAAKAWGDEARWQEGNGTMQAIAKPRAKTP